jgi:hypothetical protein
MFSTAHRLRRCTGLGEAQRCHKKERKQMQIQIAIMPTTQEITESWETTPELDDVLS